MKILITGICGFTGSILARTLQEFDSRIELWGIDNFLRAGSEQNRAPLRASGVHLFHGDVRCRTDLDVVPEVHWVIDAAANPSVLAVVNGDSSSRQVLEHNLVGTISLLEFCRQTGAGLILLSTGRVYSIASLVNLPVTIENEAYRPQLDSYCVVGLSSEGVAENFPITPPVSLYGIFAFWINSYLRRRPLKYIGFDGQRHQVRDCLHPRDVAALVWKQMQSPDRQVERVQNVGGGVASAMSLAQVSSWCAARFGKHAVGREAASRPYDVPWMVLDSGRAKRHWDWQATVRVEQILEEIAQHAEAHPEWLEVSGYV